MTQVARETLASATIEGRTVTLERIQRVGRTECVYRILGTEELVRLDDSEVAAATHETTLQTIAALL